MIKVPLMIAPCIGIHFYFPCPRAPRGWPCGSCAGSGRASWCSRFTNSPYKCPNGTIYFVGRLVRRNGYEGLKHLSKLTAVPGICVVSWLLLSLGQVCSIGPRFDLILSLVFDLILRIWSYLSVLYFQSVSINFQNKY